MKKTLTLLTSAALLLPTLAFAQTAPAAPATTTTPAPATAPAASTAVTRAKTPKTKTAKVSKPLPTKVIHINSAALPDLLALPEVTAKIAGSIMKNRPFKNADELVKKVSGIGPKNVKKLLPYIDFQ